MEVVTKTVDTALLYTDMKEIQIVVFNNLK